MNVKKPLAADEILGITEQYYSHFCCCDIGRLKTGTHFICSEERENEVRGFGARLTLFVLKKGGLLTCAFAPKHRKLMEGLHGLEQEEILSRLCEAFPLTQNELFVFTEERVFDYGSARKLAAEDYPLYEAFFRAASPDSDPEGWLREYFEEKAGKGLFFGSFADGRLVSVSDAPDMPYMEDQIQHTGIVTLPEYRRMGHAARTAGLAAHSLIENGICPQWECGTWNKASYALALSLGYSFCAHAYLLEE